MTRMFRKSLLLGLVMLLAGCGAHAQPEPQKLLGAPKPPPPVPAAKPLAIDPALQTRSIAEIHSALKSSDEVLRAHALEVTKTVQLADAEQLILAALSDRSALVRKAAALAAGELQLHDANDRLVQNLDAAKVHERIGIIFALHRLGDMRFSHELEKTAVDTDAHVRGETALVFGLLGEKSATAILYHMMMKDADPSVQLQAAGSLWKLGDERALDELVGGTISRYPDDQMISILALAGPHDTRTLGNVESQLANEDYPEVALVSARATGMLGSDNGYGVAIKGAKSVDPRQRFLAAMAFGEIGRADEQPILAKLLDDPDPDVRLGAAEALLLVGQKANG